MACFSFPQSLPLLAKSLSYDYRPGWKSLSAIIKDAFIPLPQVLVGVGARARPPPTRPHVLSNTFFLVWVRVLG